jgi:hypothetical protein
MQDTNLISFLNTIMAENPMVFYSLAIIIIAYSAACLLYLIDPKNRNLFIFISIPIIIAINVIAVSICSQIGEMIKSARLADSFRLFQLFLLCNGM